MAIAESYEYGLENLVKEKYENITGARIFAESLKRENVEYVFAYTGGANLPIFEVLSEYDINVLICGHEQGGTHMAEGYAMASGKPGVVLVTSGPGATNTVTGIADAWSDSVPLVVFTGQVPSNKIGTDAFQEVDILGITRSITKYNDLVRTADELSLKIKEMFYLSNSGRPRPTLLDICKDAQMNSGHMENFNEIIFPLKKRASRREIYASAELIKESKRPVLYVGGGAIISGAHEEIKTLAEKVNAYVTTTLKGIGAFPENHSLSLKMLGMHGSVFANYAVNGTPEGNFLDGADLLIALGARFDDRVTGNVEKFARNAKKIHVDIDNAEINKIMKVNLGINSDLNYFLQALGRIVQEKEMDNGWKQRVESWKRHYPFDYNRENDFIQPQYIIEEINRQTNGNAVITTGVGQHQMWAAQYYTYKFPRQLLTSGGLGTMGFGLPAAIGARLANPDLSIPIICIDGDQSTLMTDQEYAVLSRYGIKVYHVILDNKGDGMVKQWQKMNHNNKLIGSHFPNDKLDFVLTAKSRGLDSGEHISKREDVPPAIERMLNSKDSYILQCHVVDDHCLPMIPGNGAIEDIKFYQKKEN